MSEYLSRHDIERIATYLDDAGHPYSYEQLLEHDAEQRKQLEALQRRVEWTKVKPQTYGDYWFRESKKAIPYIVYINEKLKAYIDGDYWATVDEVCLSRGLCEWAGPIEPPHEARG